VRATHLLAIGIGVAVTLLATAPDAQAQRRGRSRYRGEPGLTPELGPRVGYDFTADDWSVGGQIRLPGRALELLLSADYYFESNAHPYQLNADLVLRLGKMLRGLYAGGGVGTYQNGSTDVAPNIVIGLEPRRRAGRVVHPYMEGRLSFLDNATPFRFVFGLNLVPD
jgi:hypothetical protein